MAAPFFTQTTRSLGDDGSSSSLVTIALAAVMLVVWAAWFTLAKVRLVEISEHARLETSAVAHPIQSTVMGRVVRSNLVLDREVHAGDVLVELDSQAERLQLDDANEKLAADDRQLEFLRNELAESEATRKDDMQASRAALAMSRAREREAIARAKLALEESNRFNLLRANGHVGELEALRATSEASERQAAAEASGQEAARTSWDMKKRGSELAAMIERLHRDLAATEGERLQLGTRIEQLEHEIERRKIRSAADGRIGELVSVAEGSVLQAGDVLGAVIPPGELRVVADFSAATAIGRIERGNPAQIRLAGFSWAEYGALRATVTSVGNEARDGLVRAELHLDPGNGTPIPVQHGLAGIAEVEVERITPVQLVLRAAGVAMAPPQPQRSPAAAPQASIPQSGGAP